MAQAARRVAVTLAGLALASTALAFPAGRADATAAPSLHLASSALAAIPGAAYTQTLSWENASGNLGATWFVVILPPQGTPTRYTLNSLALTSGASGATITCTSAPANTVSAAVSTAIKAGGTPSGSWRSCPASGSATTVTAVKVSIRSPWASGTTGKLAITVTPTPFYAAGAATTYGGYASGYGALPGTGALASYTVPWATSVVSGTIRLDSATVTATPWIDVVGGYSYGANGRDDGGAGDDIKVTGSTFGRVSAGADGSYSLDGLGAGRYRVIVTTGQAGDVLTAVPARAESGSLGTEPMPGNASVQVPAVTLVVPAANTGVRSASQVSGVNFRLADQLAMSLADDAASTTVGVPVNGNVLANDQFTQRGRAYAPRDGVEPDLVSLVVTQHPAHGSVTLRLDGGYTYTPAAGYTGTDTWRYSLSDMQGNVAQATVQMTITAAGSSSSSSSSSTSSSTSSPSGPQVAGSSFVVASGGSTTQAIDLRSGTLAQAVLAANPAAGRVSVDVAARQIRYEALGAPAGSYPFTVQWTDAAGQTGQTSYTAVVVAPPSISASPRRAEVAGGSSRAFQLAIGSSDPNGVDAYVSAHSQAALVQSASVADGILRVTAKSGVAGTDVITVTAADSLGQTATTTVEVTVATPLSGTGRMVQLDTDAAAVLVDPVGDASGTGLKALTEADLGQPSHGHVALAGQLVSYTPEPGYEGVTWFTVTVTDALGQTATLTYVMVVDLPGGEDVPLPSQDDLPAGASGGTSATPPSEVATGGAAPAWLAGLPGLAAVGALLATGLAVLLVHRPRRGFGHRSAA